MEAERRVHPVNIANAFTMLRVGLVPVFAWLLVFRDPSAPVLASLVFAFAAATDAVDGWLARRLQLVSGFGAFLDPLADKLLVGTALVPLAADGRIPWWAVGVILAREFLVGVVLRVELMRRGRALPASRLGKVKTLVQIGAVFVLTALDKGHPAALATLYVAVALTVVSGYLYFRDVMRGRAHVPWS
ncbi:MAG: CDP-diacylglycerol--glycerol-3-phosphate 3-phosphatidyltransferase [Actinomycetota bacterium]